MKLGVVLPLGGLISRRSVAEKHLHWLMFHCVMLTSHFSLKFLYTTKMKVLGEKLLCVEQGREKVNGEERVEVEGEG